MNRENGDVAAIYAFGVILLLITGWIYWDYFSPPWKDYQAGFRALVTKQFGAEKARDIPDGIQQVWAADLHRTDRCVTCHLGMEWDGLENAPNPYRTHPKAILKNHPIAQYGCTVCHGGEGFATGLETAHAITSEHWEEPLLASELGKGYQIEDAKAMIQINCNTCHRYDKETEGAGYINAGKQIVQDKKCSVCHKINGQGGAIGPDLSDVGDRSPEHFDYTHLPGKATIFGWHIAHFKNPKEMTPTTVMPNFNFGPKESQALTMLMLSWRRVNLPTAFIPAPKTASPPAAAAEPPKEQPAAVAGK